MIRQPNIGFAGRSMVRTAVLLAGACLTGATAASADESPTDFFEKKIRPVLVEHCYSCHSADARKNKKLKGGLMLDTRAAVLKGGDSGPSLVPGKPDESVLLSAMHGKDYSLMPPKGKLPDAVLADFATWIKMGAPDPRAETVAAGGGRTGMSVEAGRGFWSFKAPVKFPAPAVKDAAWPKDDIDRFVLAGLESKGLRPAGDADRRVLVRRLYFDLLGLPPSPEAIEEFIADKSADATEKLVDRLLASPQFGERWGRHWLDVARYAESLTLRGFILKDAWRYRDYVIESFNRDLPFDRFVREQIAGDLLPDASGEGLAEQRRRRVAVSFLLMGNTNLEEQDKKLLNMDVVDEQLDVITKGFLAQTVTCARCHDHKFDPIPTRDYYAMAGILAAGKTLEHSNVSKWIEMPLPGDPAAERDWQKHEAAVAALQARIKDLKAKPAAKPTKDGPAPSRNLGVVAAATLPGIVVDDAAAKKVGEWKHSVHSGHYIDAGYLHDDAKGKGEKTLTFHPDLPAAGKYEVWFAYSPGTSRSKAVQVTVLSADGEKELHVNQQDAPAILGRFVSLGQYQFERGNQGYVIVSNEDTTGHVTADAIVFVPADQVQAAIAGKSGKPVPSDTPTKATAKSDPKGKAKSDGKASVKGDAAEELAALEAELKTLQANAPRRDASLAIREDKSPADIRIHIRGSVANLGAVAPRGFLSVATTGPTAAIPAGQSGRVQLADWIASPANPLTARVMVNRVWHWMFGSGIVRTTDNFGVTGELPSHPELLDRLAVDFVEGGWSVKKLVRRIALSRTYRQGSFGPASTLKDPAARALVEADPENRTFGRSMRRRLDAECIRDTMLAVAGTLKLTPPGGPTYGNLAADYTFTYRDTLRSVYVPVFRNSLPEVQAAFDFADPSLVVGKRDTSTVAPQALLLLNHPMVLEQARAAAERVLTEEHPDAKARLTRAWMLALGRAPLEGELAAALRHLQSSNGADTIGNRPGSGGAKVTDVRRDAWAGVMQALYGSIGFRFVE